MKQTNNAIKFLMAQYRAIFKNAYFKGLTTAVALTATLAAGSQSVAADTISGVDSWDKITTDTVGTVTKNDTTVVNKNFYDINIESGSLKSDTGNIYFKNKINVAAKATLNVGSGDGSTISSISGYKAISQDGYKQATGDLESHGNINIKGGNADKLGSYIHVRNATLAEGSTTVLSGSGATKWDHATQLVAGFGAEGGKLDIQKGASVELSNRAALMVVANSSMDISGTIDFKASGTDAIAILRATDNYCQIGDDDVGFNTDTNSVINILEGAKLNVAAGTDGNSGAAGIYSAQTNIKGGEIIVNNKSTLTLDGDFVKKGVGLSQASNNGAGMFTMTDGTIDLKEGSTLLVGSGSYSVENTSTDAIENGQKTTLDIQGGKLIGSGTLELKGNLKINESVLDGFIGGTNQGHINVATGTTSATRIEIVNAKEGVAVDLSDYGFSGNNTKHIQIGNSSGATFYAKDLAVSSKLGEIGSSAQLNLEAENLTLGGGKNNNTGDLGFTKATTKNVTFKDSAPNTAFILNNDLTLTSTRDISGVDVADDGSIVGNVTISGGKLLTVNGGSYTDEHAITLSSGSLVIGKAESKVNSSLTLSGELIFAQDKNNTITVESTNKDATAILDLTDATSVKFNKTPVTAENKTTINVKGEYATLKIKGDDLTGLLHAGSGTSGAAVVISGGNVEVTGNLGSLEKAISAGDILSNDASSISGGDIIFADNTTGKLSADSLFLKAAANEVLSFNKGNIEVNTLNLAGVDTNKTLKFNAGNLTVLNGISNNNNTLENLEIGGGQLFLGQLNTDNTAAIGGGSVGVKNLKITSGGVTFQGIWNADNVETSAASGVSIGQFGEVKFNTLKASAADSVDIENGGSLTVHGLSEAGKNGVNLATNSIDLKGQLTLGKDIADDITIKDGKVSAGDIKSGAIKISGGTLQVDFGSDRTFSSADLGALKKHFFNKDGVIDGTLHIGYGKIGELDLGEKDENGRYDFSNVANVSDVIGNEFTNNDLTNNAFTTTNGQNVGGTVGAIHVTNGSSANISNSAGFVNSSTNKGFFVSTNQNGQDVAADINFTGSKLSLKNGGAAGEISLDSSKSTLSISATDDKQITNLKSISGGKKLEIAGNTVVEKDVSTNEAVIDKSLKAQNATFASLSSTKAETAGSLDITKDLTVSSTKFTGDIKVAGKATFGADNQSTYLAGNNTFNELEFKSNAQLDKGTTSAQNLKLTNNNLEINGGANVKVSGVLETKGHIIVGEDQGKNETESWESSAGYLTAKRVDLAQDSILIADPDFGKAASIVAIDKVGKETETATTAGGVLRGQVVAARNSIIALGVEDSKEENAIKALQDNFAPFYMDENGSLKNDEVGAIAFVGKALTVEDGAKIVVDSKVTNTTYLARDTKATTEYNAKINGSDIYIGGNSVLGIDEDALSKKAAAIHFNKDAASVYGEQGAKIVLTGKSIGTTGAVHLFSDKGEGAESGVEIKGNDILVESINGVLKYTLTKDSTVSDIQLEVDRNAAKHKFANTTSDSTYYTLMAYNTGDLNWEDANSQNHTIDLVHNGEATDVVYDAATNQYKSGNKVLDGTLYTHKVVTNEKGEVVKYIVYNVRASNFLTVDFADSNGSSTETVSRLGMYGGAAQAAIQASASTYNSISGHLGIGSSQFSISSAANGQGGAVWVSPIYNSLDSDGLSTGGLKYGADVDLYGLALGGDFSVANGFKIGAMFNVGSGDADGNGAGSGVKNDFNYYGLGVYGTYSIDNFSVLGDLTYTVVDNDVDAQTALDKVSTSFDTKTLSLGLTAQYDIELANSLKITPHAGIRFTNVDIENYTVKGEKYGEFAYYDADNLNIFSIPVGVTFAKEFVGEAWTVKPSFDLTLTGNFGDDESKARTYWEGVENLSTEAYNEVLDNFTYGAALGVSATNGNFSFGAGLNYTGSSNTDSFGVKAMAKFVF